MRRTYLDNVPLDEALTNFITSLRKKGWPPGDRCERIPTVEAFGRVASRTHFSRYPLPHYSAAAMDGYAVRAKDTYGVSERWPRRLKLGEDTLELSTGNPVPDGFDAVVMKEHASRVGCDEVEIVEAAVPGQNIRRLGSEIAANEPVVFPGKRIGPTEVGALLSVGQVSLDVYRHPRITIVPTGDELVPPRDESPAPGEVVEFNSAMLSGLAMEENADVSVRKPVGDDRGVLAGVIREAVADSDIVVVNAGSSVGPHDHCAEAIRDVGDLLVHGVAIRPGRPIVLGIVESKPVVGLPGYPVSSYLGFELFVRPLIRRFLGLPIDSHGCVRARASRQVTSSLGYDEFIMVRVGVFDQGTIAAPLARGAANIGSLARTHGFVRVPRLSEGFDAGEEVDVRLLKRGFDPSRVVLVQGIYHDIIDDLCQAVSSELGLELSFLPSGPANALRAIRKSEAHSVVVPLEEERIAAGTIHDLLQDIPGDAFSVGEGFHLVLIVREDWCWSGRFTGLVRKLVQGGSLREGFVRS